MTAPEPSEPPAEGDPRGADARWVDWLLGFGIGARALYSVAMIPLIPLLIVTAPLLLTLLSGSMVAEVGLGARVRIGQVPWLVAVLAGVPIWVLTDWLYWAAGRRWGDRALVSLMGRGDPAQLARRVDRVHWIAHRLGPFGVVVAKLLPVPGPFVYAVAGTGRMRLWVFVVLNLVGTLITSVVVVSLGFALGYRAITVVEEFQQYALASTVAVALVVVLVIVLRRRRGGSGRLAE